MFYQKFSLRLIFLFTLWLLTFSLVLHDQTVSTSQNPYEKKTLANGLSIIHQKDKSSPITVVQILIKGGKKAEPEGLSGLAYLTTQLALQIPDQTKVQEMMKQASRVNMLGKADYTLIKIECLSENLEATLNITTHIILKPLFSGLRINRIKKVMLYGRKIQEDDSINVGHNVTLEKFFAGTSYGGSAHGSEESLKAIKKKSIKKFHKDYFQAGNISVAVISDMEKEPLFEILEKYFSKFPSGKSPEIKQMTFSAPEEKKTFIVKDSKQYYISLAYPLPEINPQNFGLASLLENLLGKGPGSRLWALRSEEKLAYNVNCTATQMEDGGILNAYLETDKKKKEIALEALQTVLRDLYENGITEEEFEATKIYTKASFLRKNETKETRANNLAAFEALGLGYEYLNRFSQEIETIGLEQINAYIKNILNPEYGLEIIVGPEQEKQNFQSI
jgi:predicted Zn-dependent peptidase